LHLPKLQLPTFSGDPLKWMEYRDAFDVAVHQQKIPNVQKFNYLLSTLKGAAYSAIEGLAVTNDNYEDANNILYRRFGDVEEIRGALYAQIANLQKATEKPIDLRNTLEGVECVCRQLKSLGEEVDSPMLVRTVQEKLPVCILEELEKHKSTNDRWNMSELREELEKLIHRKEVAHRIHHEHVENRQSTGQRSSTPPTETFAAVVPINDGNSRYGDNRRGQEIQSSNGRNWSPKCVFCRGDHYNDTCTIVPSVEARRNKALDQRLCLRCLNSSQHISRNCPRTKACFHCRQGDHNAAFCWKREREELNGGKYGSTTIE
jgi:hypothetical protein